MHDMFPLAKFLWPLKARPLYITADFFILSAKMKYQPWDLNQTWPVGRKCCQKFLGPSLPKFAAQKNIIFYHLFAPSTLDTAYLWNETSRRQTKMLVSVYNVPPKR